MKLTKLLEDVINNVTFDIKFSEEGEELMDYIKSDVSFSEELDQINLVLSKMKEDGIYSKSKAYDMYADLVNSAARQYTRDMHGDFKEEDYFLDKDIISLSYYFMKKFEIPMSGEKSDNIDVPPPAPQGEVPPAGEEVPPAGGEVPPVPPEGMEVPPADMGAPPAGEEVPPEGMEAPPEEGGEESGMPKPEDAEKEEIRERIKKRSKKVWKKHY